MRSADKKTYFSTKDGWYNATAVGPMGDNIIDFPALEAILGVNPKDKKRILDKVDENLKSFSSLNKNQAKATIVKWGERELAALMANEILHRLSDDKNRKEGYTYDRSNAIAINKNVRVWGFDRRGDSILYRMLDFDMSLKTLDTKTKPSYKSFLHADAIMQAIYDGQWPELK